MGIIHRFLKAIKATEKIKDPVVPDLFLFDTQLAFGYRSGRDPYNSSQGPGAF